MRILVLSAVCLFLFSGLQYVAAQSQLQLPPPVDGGVAFREILVPGNGQGFAGLAALDASGPVIYYDSIWMQRIGGVGSAGFRFTRAHEYAHHRLSHTIQQYNTPPALLPLLGFTSEIDADCWAVKALKSAGDSAAIDEGFRIYQSVLPAQDSQGRPGAVRRTQNMNTCLGVATQMGRSCQTQIGRCGPFFNQPALPVGSGCYCATPGGPAGGVVVQP